MKVVSVIWAILRGLLWALADEFPLGGRTGASRDAGTKERPWWSEKPAADKPATETPTTSKPADTAKAPTWWAKPTPPASPPTIKVETDAGTFVSRATFSGDHMLGIRRVERTRQEGESRRHRRTTGKTAPASPVTREAVELHAREPAVPQATPHVEPVPHRDVELLAREPAIPTETASALVPTRDGVAQPIDPGEVARVARARRVRGRLAPTDTSGSSLLVTTLATRLALTDSAASVAARKGDSA